MSKLKIGWAEESLVPEKKVDLSGQFYERISEYVEDDISVTAMAVESDGDEMILISADILNIGTGVLELAREKLSHLLPDFPTEKLVVAATHTHTSLAIADVGKSTESEGFASAQAILNEFLPDNKQYTSQINPDETVLTAMEGAELLTEQIAQAAKKAWENREEAYMANEFGRAAVGMCRRVTYLDGSAQMWGDTNTGDFVALEGGNDSGMELIYTFNKEKKLIGVAANICCPAQILEQRYFISGDYWAKVRKDLEARVGRKIFVLGLCGAAGDQCPRDLVRWKDPETPINDPNVHRPNVVKRKADPSMYDVSGCKRVAKRISNEILSVLEEVTEYRDEAVLQHKVMALDLPLRKATKAEYDFAVREMEYYADRNKDKEEFNFVDVARMHVHAGTIARYRCQQFTEVYTIELHVIRFGNIAMVTNPFELFLDYGNRMKARSLAEQTFIIQLACGEGGYLPTEKAEKGGHYSAYISSGFVGHEGGDLLTRYCIEEINKMFR